MHIMIYHNMIWYHVIWAGAAPSARTRACVGPVSNHVAQNYVPPVSVNTAPEKGTLGKSSLKNTKSGGGYEFLVLDYRAKAWAKGMLCSHTGITHKMYWHLASASTPCAFRRASMSSARLLFVVSAIVRTICVDTGVCDKNTPPEKKTCGKLSFKHTKSEAGEQFLLLCCKAKALWWKECFFPTDAGICSRQGFGFQHRSGSQSKLPSCQTHVGVAPFPFGPPPPCERGQPLEV